MPSTGNNHPITSHEAEKSVRNVKEIHEIILDLLEIQPSTDTFLREAYTKLRESYGWPKVAESSIRARRSELVTLGLVEPSGEYELLDSGRRSIIWRVVEREEQ